MYIHDVAASVVRPVKELKGILKITLDPGEEQSVVFTIEKKKDLMFLTENNCWDCENGAFEVMIGASSMTENKKTFYLI